MKGRKMSENTLPYQVYINLKDLSDNSETVELVAAFADKRAAQQYIEFAGTLEQPSGNYKREYSIREA